MTLVWKTETGTLLQTQVGLADVVTTLSAAHAIFGWLGGLDGAKFLLSKIPNSFSKSIKELGLEKSLRLLPVTVHVLTSGGPLTCSISNAADAFGGDARTQLIGLTISPGLFDGADIAIDALRSQLNDASHLQRIINEGASRGLTNLFTNAVSGLNISFGDREWLRQNLMSKDDMEPLPSEILMVGGLLKWILREDREPYYTRSGLVARVAAYMKEVGYAIGRIQAWNGIGSPPTSLGSKAILLVTGGSSSTDPLMLDPQEMVQHRRTHHYQYKTVGAMLMDALDNVSKSFPEVFQTHFEAIFAYMKAHLNIRYVVNVGYVGSRVDAKFDWKPPAKGHTSIEMRLASIYFPLSAEYMAPCYSSIASSEYLDQILKNKSAITSYDEIPEALALFRVLSAAIVISVTARLADGTFEAVSHSTELDLSTEDMWLEPMCKILDGAHESGLGLHKAVSILAAVHAAHDPELIKDCDFRVLAWRRGVYAVVPSILLNMTPTKEAIGFRCLDQFWANVTVREDGSIRSAQTKAYLQDLDMMEDVVAKGAHSLALQSLNYPWLGPPSPSTPDTPLYLSVERPLHYSAPDLCFVGRIGGSVVGAVGIDDVLRVLLRSLNEPSVCLGHTSSSTVVNVKASSWATSKYSKPASEELITFIPVSGDPSWALFLAGESASFNGRIVFKCVECAANEAGSHGVLIGYL